MLLPSSDQRDGLKSQTRFADKSGARGDNARSRRVVTESDSSEGG